MLVGVGSITRTSCCTSCKYQTVVEKLSIQKMYVMEVVCSVNIKPPLMTYANLSLKLFMIIMYLVF